jgi:hypothetical protein
LSSPNGAEITAASIALKDARIDEKRIFSTTAHLDRRVQKALAQCGRLTALLFRDVI